MKIDFDLLDELVAAGATAAVIVTLLKKQYDGGEAKRKRDSARVTRQRATPRDIAPPVADEAPQLKLVSEQPSKPKRAPRPVKRRNDDGWKGSQELFEYGRRIGLSASEVEAEWIKFYGHHKAKGSEMVDWDQAWRNWARKAMTFAGKTPRDPSKPLEDDTKPREVSMSLERWKRVLTIYGSTNNWNAAFGPPPGEKGCKVPPELLAEAEPEFEIDSK